MGDDLTGHSPHRHHPMNAARQAMIDHINKGGKWQQMGDFVGTFVGKSDEFKQLIIAALKAKKMSKADFNKAVEAHVKPGATKEEKTAAGEKMLHFLASKKVKIS